MSTYQEKIIILSKDEVQQCPFPEFYSLVASKLDANPDSPEIRYDCTRILIAQNIQSFWYEYYEAKGADSYSITIMLCQSRPKVDKTLPDNHVRVLKGFIIDSKEEAK